VILEVKELSKAFEGIKAVDGVSFGVEDKGISSIIGPNGAGKTTLFNILTGYFLPDSGRVIFKGEDITGLPPYKLCRKGIGRSFQIISIFPQLTVFDSVQTALLARRGKTLTLFSPAKKMLRDETFDILETVELSDQAKSLSGELSHGDQRRMELGIALAAEPEVLLLDEPTAGMAPHERVATVKLLKRISEERNLPLLFIEHDMDVVFGISQEIRVMAQGKLIAQGKPEDIRSNKEVRRIYLGEEEA